MKRIICWLLGHAYYHKNGGSSLCCCRCGKVRPSIKKMLTNKGSTMYALFKDDKQISKAHTTQAAVIIEAYERKFVTSCSSDFMGEDADVLDDGIEIREVGDNDA